MFQEPEQSWQDVTQILGENILVLNDWQNILEISVIPFSSSNLQTQCTHISFSKCSVMEYQLTFTIFSICYYK